jgi:hypothetical protein
MAWNFDNTSGVAKTSAKEASAGKVHRLRTAGVGKIMAPTSFRLIQVRTASGM